MKSHVWRGYHSKELQDQIKRAWDTDTLLYVGSPAMKEVPLLDERMWHDRPKPVLAVLTSGTTSSPRFVYYSKENIESSLNAIVSLFDQKRIDTIFCYPQPFHTFGLTLGYVLAMLKGWRLVTPTSRYSREAHAIRAAVEGPSVLTLGTPVHFKDLRKYLLENKLALPPSYSAIVGGAPVSVELWKSLRDDLRIEAPSIGYGCSEASPGLTHLPPGQEPKADCEIGYPLANTHMHLVPNQGIEFNGPNMCLAMEQNGQIIFPEKVLIRDNVQAEGTWTYHGRFDLVINCGGQKLSLEAIEKALHEEFALDFCCLGISDPRMGEELGVIIQTSSTVDKNRIAEFILRRFDKRILFENIYVSEFFPLNVNGKLDRKVGALWIQKAQKFPLLVSNLEKWTPHRAPMVWVDEVLSANESSGECLVNLKNDALYMTAGNLRLSSMIEFVAQSYGYLRCAQSLAGLAPAADRPRRAFLVGTSETNFKIEEGDSRVQPGQELRLKISDIRILQTFVLCHGEIFGENGDSLMSTKIKLFHE